MQGRECHRDRFVGLLLREQQTGVDLAGVRGERRDDERDVERRDGETITDLDQVSSICDHDSCQIGFATLQDFMR
jgi:hypothetical protein